MPKGIHCFLGRILARLQGHESLGTLSLLLIRDRYHGALQDGGMLGNGLLDLNGRDVLTTRNDDILLRVSTSLSAVSKMTKSGLCSSHSFFILSPV